MKKVRVTKEFPFVNVGDEFLISGDSLLININGLSNGLSFETRFLESGMIGKWLEWVEEDKTLEEKFEETLVGTCIEVDNPKNYTAVKMLLHEELDKLAQIARTHALEVFNKKEEEICRENTTYNQKIKCIRKALEQL